jgi:hypothetical protein
MGSFIELYAANALKSLKSAPKSVEMAGILPEVSLRDSSGAYGRGNRGLGTRLLPLPKDYMLVAYTHFFTERRKDLSPTHGMAQAPGPLYVLERFFEDTDHLDDKNLCLYPMSLPEIDRVPWKGTLSIPSCPGEALFFSVSGTFFRMKPGDPYYEFALAFERFIRILTNRGGEIADPLRLQVDRIDTLFPRGKT